MGRIGTGALVVVNGAAVGVVEYVTRDGFFGVRLAGEGERVDEWHPTQVELFR